MTHDLFMLLAILPSAFIINSIMLDSTTIRNRFLQFFNDRGHAILPSASLVPENDPSVLFNTAGMQPLVPYLLGERHPKGTRLVDSQKCVRTVDIDEIGDNTHATFFEMLGNWSLGDYFKQDAINWSFEFLMSKEKGLALDPKRLYVTVFGGNEDAPRDDEAFAIWAKLFEAEGINPDGHIFYMTVNAKGKEPNWWSPGENGPCGPDSEMFYNASPDDLGDLSKEDFIAADDRVDVVEIWNDVFMEYEKKDGVVIGRLSKQNVDTGSGLERILMIVQGVDNIFDTDLFSGIMDFTKTISSDLRSARILADHFRTAIFLIADGVRPSNSDQGYILRRVIRRAVMRTSIKKIDRESIESIVDIVCAKYADIYTNIKDQRGLIIDVIDGESKKFEKSVEQGLKQFERLIAKGSISGREAFDLYQSYGFPIEITLEIASEKNISVDEVEYKSELEAHQAKSRAGAEQKFKGGLADNSEMVVKYHTATHLLHRALHIVLGETATQKGSNITTERMRFDFAHPQKMTPDEIKRVEELVNEAISKNLPVLQSDVTFDEAKARGATGLFADKYGDVVRVYQIGEGDDKFSIEMCGGPHVSNTGDLGHFKIVKEEASSAGIRRIKAVLS
jgi:alanyl-tRNA synthetase